MAFQPPSARQELANRKILEEIQLKKQQILKQGVAPSLNSPTITPSLSAVGTTVNLAYGVAFAGQGKGVNFLIDKMKRSELFHMIKAHPALLLGAGLVCTASIVITYTKFLRPALKRQKSDEAEVYAEYLFQQESKKLANKSNS